MTKRTGFLDGQLSFGDDFDTLGQAEIEAAFSSEPDPDPATQDGLATKEQGTQLCEVCEFPAIAGHVQGELRRERYSLHVCPSCFEYAILCLRDSYRQNRLFDDDFEIQELCDFGKKGKWQEENRKAIDAYNEHVEAHGVFATDMTAWEQMKPVGWEFGADEFEAKRILERVKSGEEQTFTSDEVRKDLGLED